MSRAKTGVVRRRKHKKVLKLAKGYRGTNSRLFKRAHEAVLHAGAYAYIGRKLRKRDMRKLWIMRINGALKTIDDKVNREARQGELRSKRGYPGVDGALGQKLKYSRFINQLKKANVMLNRKMLSEIAIADNATFKEIVKKVSA